MRKKALIRLTLVSATVKDASALVAFEHRVTDPKIYGPPLDAPGALRELSQNRFYFIWIDDTLVGTAAYRLRPDNTVYISNVAVDPAYRHRGIARSAVSFILEKCREARRIDLVTHPENKNALQFYKSLGFNVESREENYFGDGEPRLILALTHHQL